MKVIALEGPHRCGKGTQTALLSQKLSSLGYDTKILRGDGSRQGDGATQYDPPNDWWIIFRSRLNSFSMKDQYKLWDEAAVRLATELIEQKKQADDNTILILDRSLISRLALAHTIRPHCYLNELYVDGAGKPLPKLWKEVCPDLIIYLEVSRQELLNRLDVDPDDAKYNFRKNNIIERFEWYNQVPFNLPMYLRYLTVKVVGEGSRNDVFSRIWNCIRL